MSTQTSSNEEQTLHILSNPQPIPRSVIEFLIQTDLLDYLSDNEAIKLLECCPNYYTRHYSQYRLKEFYSIDKVRRVLLLWKNDSTDYSIHQSKSASNNAAMSLLCGRPIFTHLCHISSMAEANLLQECLPFITLTHLAFGFEFNQAVDTLPSSLTHLTFGYRFDQAVDNLPSSVTHLTFGAAFNQAVDNLPSSLTHLTFGRGGFNQAVDNLPCSLTHLTFGYMSNQSVDKLPSSLTHLRFGFEFNQAVDTLPSSLTHLTFGYRFDQAVDNLPSSVTHLTFDDNFNQAVDNLPSSLTQLKFGRKFNQAVDNLPSSLTHLTFAEGFNQSLENLPSSLTHLEVGQIVMKLPRSVVNRLKQAPKSELSTSSLSMQVTSLWLLAGVLMASFVTYALLHRAL
jgi:hypothetical protein